ncbi:hypothetical protein MLD63_06190 [Paracoccus sp. TK19116]|uniref:Acyltransferase n=1 Tax=Paracoccus albicereus TaxID=2922394 RepID=A0ABT1MPH0_9RHOB|nr:hypothetical protein [Paracoccus albicereus]MCQ0970014.1 hypothetical protein [Paracoccus albicereus]
MILIATLLIGAFVGWRKAARLQGDRLDRLQYAAVHAMIFAVIGLFVTLMIDRMA